MGMLVDPVRQFDFHVPHGDASHIAQYELYIPAQLNVTHNRRRSGNCRRWTICFRLVVGRSQELLY